VAEARWRSGGAGHSVGGGRRQGRGTLRSKAAAGGGQVARRREDDRARERRRHEKMSSHGLYRYIPCAPSRSSLYRDPWYALGALILVVGINILFL